MHIIKLNAIDSTNSYLKKLSAQEALDDFTIVMTEAQLEGRGQMGSVWTSKSSKNLTFSVYKKFSGLEFQHVFYISIATSLALVKTLQFFSIPKLAIKWPNDILAENKKICGILIENIMRNQTVSNSIIGMGLNVNQTEFENLPKASSLKLITGDVYNIDELAILIVNNLKIYFNKLNEGQFEDLKLQYEDLLFRKNKPSTFKDAEGLMFSGIIKGVSNYGNLQVLLEDDIIKEFSLKEITLIY
ncbi:biotin--[acetyl-CoA-carboxylase] ligase [Siansivirga zeaxanthinifaciens]|uniref:Ligase n=1 Tax=Siansivirga zeaxanthinifaciens CC-SAMT-1 TaxID=1454006 RepID=A0A0C5W843_9FLAO|nr:biotin--[acetyl-CoA-carboxylase] ligase [Siansivirga zeaxanthinifaciens]AJR02427.1 ligase [Siansivirga zeaxanthinifaciens CC-SAMT-1]